MAAGPTVAPSKASPTNRKRVDVAILGARMHYAVARILAQADLLGTLYTDTYLGNKPVLGGFLRRVPPRYRPTAVRKLLGREAQGVPAQRIVSFDTLGLKAGWSRRRIRSRGELLELNVRIAKEFCDRVVRCGFGDAGAVYALNWVALEIFREARRRGLFTILEQIIAPAPVEYDLLAAETRRWPGAQDRAAVDPANNPLVRRGEAEWPLADCIVCGSEFVAQSLVSQGVDPRRCHVIPYGVDTSVFHPRREPGRGDELKVLFVGAVGLRKGVPYLLEALRKLKGASLQCRLAGDIEIDRRWLSEHAGEAQIMGAIPRSEIISLYHWADVFVLPSICEGSATVTYEALACGLPVITTPNSGSVVRDGKDGFVIPIRDSHAIAARLSSLANDRGMLRAMSANARQRSEGFSVERYGERLLGIIEGFFKDGRKTDSSG